MSQEDLNLEQKLERWVLDYLVTQNLRLTAATFLREANITNEIASALNQPGRGILRNLLNFCLNPPTLGAHDSQAAAYAQLSAINSDGVPLSRERLRHSHSTDFRSTPQHFDAHRVSLPPSNTNHQGDGQLIQPIPGGGSIAQHIQGMGIVDDLNVVEMPSVMHRASMPTNFGLGGAGFDQGTSGFLSEWGVPSTGTHGNMDPRGSCNIHSGGLDKTGSRTQTISQKRPTNSELGKKKLQYQLQQLQYHQRQQQQQQQQSNLQQLLQERRKQQAVKQAFAQEQEARKRRKHTSATEAGTSANPVGLLRSSIGGGLVLVGDSGTPVGPTSPPLMTSIRTPGVGDSRNPVWTLGDRHIDTPGAGLLSRKQKSAERPKSEDSVTSRNPVDPPSAGPPLARDSGNPVGPSSTATPGDGLPSARDFTKGSGT